MDFGISQEGCFDRALIVQRAVPASRTGNTALPCRMSPTFSFCLAKKKCAGHGTKEKAFEDELTQECQLIRNGGLIGMECRGNPEFGRLR